MCIRLLQIWFLVEITQAVPFKGGIISWIPVDPSNNASTTVEVIIYQKHSWPLNRFQCNQSTIDTLGWYTDNGGPFTGELFVQCLSAAASCTASGFTTVSQRTYCTDFSNVAQSSSGALLSRKNLAQTTNIVVGYVSTAWSPEIRMANGTSASNFRVVSRIDLGQGFPINTPPVIASLPVVRLIEGQTAVITFPILDWDTSNDLRCRWASSSGAAGDECGDVCGNLPNATLSTTNACIIRWSAVRRPFDISAGVNISTYVAALMLEDFSNVTSTTPMSSVPLQVLISTYQRPAGACSILPEIIGDRPNRACIGASINVTLVERIVARVFCAGNQIVEFITSSPLFMTKTAIAPVNGTTNLFYITLTWTPRDDQKGAQVFCAAPVDQLGLTGSQYCIDFIVGYAAPNLIRPSAVQGSASPVGTVFANQSLFRIQATQTIYRPTRNGTYIQIYEKTNSTLVWQVDCGYSPSCTFIGQTLFFNVPNTIWTLGAHYYISFGSGVVSGNDFCRPESAPITDPTFWTFDIWSPSASSTTPTTTTPPTTVTVTTRPVGTTTPNANLTTTGIGMSTSTTITTVTTTRTTTSSFRTIQTNPNIPKEPENQSREPMIIGIVIGVLVLLLIIAVPTYIYCTRRKKQAQHLPLATFVSPSEIAFTNFPSNTFDQPASITAE